MRCPLCTAVHDAERGQFIVSHGPAMSEEKFNSRCCHYARARGREGCINPCVSVKPAETLAGRMGQLDTAMSHPEIAEVFIPTYHD
jgi:hypothetical protein